MGLVVRIEDEKGDACSSDVVDAERHFERLLPDRQDTAFQCLGFIDPYGDATFNKLQMPAVQIELNRLKKDAHREAKVVIDEIEALVLQVQQSPAHVYLRFIGD